LETKGSTPQPSNYNNSSGPLESQSLKTVLDRVDLLQAKISEQEKKIGNLTKLIDLNSSIEASSSKKSKQDWARIENLVQTSILDVTRNLVDRKMFESRLFDLESSNKKSNSNINNLNNSNRLYSGEIVSLIEFEDYKTQNKKQLSNLETKTREDLTNHMDDFDTKFAALKRTIDSRMRDMEVLSEEKMKTVERKLFETVSERSYAQHERHNNLNLNNNLEVGDSLKEKA